MKREKRVSEVGGKVIIAGHNLGMATMMIAAATGPAAPIVAIVGAVITGLSWFIGLLIPPPRK